jgi:hypothetical protein
LAGWSCPPTATLRTIGAGDAIEDGVEAPSEIDLRIGRHQLEGEAFQGGEAARGERAPKVGSGAGLPAFVVVALDAGQSALDDVAPRRAPILP